MPFRNFCFIIGFLFFDFFFSPTIFVFSAQDVNESKHLRVLIVADTKDKGIGRSVISDVSQLKYLFEELIPSQKRTVHVLQGEALTPRNLLDTIRKMRVGASDSFLIYYSGHGVIDRNNNHVFSFSTGRVLRSEVLEAMKSKKSRLCILISDCCALLEPPPPPPPTRGPVVRLEPISAHNPELVRYLFFCPQGMIDINSSKRGEAAICSDWHGGYFTSQFCRIFDKPTSEFVHPKTGVPTWDVVLDKITTALIPTRSRIEELQKWADRPYALDIEKSRGVRFLRDITPNQPIQHPSAVSKLPPIAYTKHPTGSNSLGFTYSVIPGKAIRIDEVVPGSMAMWNGLESQDLIIGVEKKFFKDENAPPKDDVYIIGPRSPIDRNGRVEQGIVLEIPGIQEALQKHQSEDSKEQETPIFPPEHGFDFENWLLSRRPFANYVNTTPGRLNVLVQKHSGNKIAKSIVVSTTKRAK